MYFRGLGRSLCTSSRGILMCSSFWSWRRTRVKKSRGRGTCFSPCGSQTFLWSEWKPIRWLLGGTPCWPELTLGFYFFLNGEQILSFCCDCRTGLWCVPVNVLDWTNAGGRSLRSSTLGKISTTNSVLNKQLFFFFFSPVLTCPNDGLGFQIWEGGQG